ncbi:hypothetical protein CgunFtcFv8_004638 [Champsocephalus gunnari]|uniref:Uncharacterized protein n=1 Tax=Champsocephalus gunnari TaxID=52237 RepID=A0AAN8E127_CHAGU|nr:hypothetical protein CgunFtcFv8_004638 [Champsocephalus gunnari]
MQRSIDTVLHYNGQDGWVRTEDNASRLPGQMDTFVAVRPPSWPQPMRNRNICPQGNKAISWCTGSRGGGKPGVSILPLNLEEETNPGSKRATVLSETSHRDGAFKVFSPPSNSTIFIKTLHLGPRLIHGEPPHGHRQSGL